MAWMAWSPPSDISTNANPPGATRLAVRDDLDLGHRAVLGERLPELVLGRREGHIAGLQVLTHRRSLPWTGRRRRTVFGRGHSPADVCLSYPAAGASPTTFGTKKARPPNAPVAGSPATHRAVRGGRRRQGLIR